MPCGIYKLNAIQQAEPAPNAKRPPKWSQVDLNADAKMQQITAQCNARPKRPIMN